jgi:hypothetical protein
MFMSAFSLCYFALDVACPVPVVGSRLWVVIASGRARVFSSSVLADSFAYSLPASVDCWLFDCLATSRRFGVVAFNLDPLIIPRNG